MEIMRLGPIGHERPFIRHDERYFSLESLTRDIDGAFLASEGVTRSIAALRAGELDEVTDAAALRVGAPIARPQAVLCIGQNYAAHAAESGDAAPDVPILFHKHPNTVVGSCDDVMIPPGVLSEWIGK